MKTVFILLLLFLGIGLFVQQFNARTRLLLLVVIVGMLAYLYLT